MLLHFVLSLSLRYFKLCLVLFCFNFTHTYRQTDRQKDISKNARKRRRKELRRIERERERDWALRSIGLLVEAKLQEGGGSQCECAAGPTNFEKIAQLAELEATEKMSRARTMIKTREIHHYQGAGSLGARQRPMRNSMRISDKTMPTV